MFPLFFKKASLDRLIHRMYFRPPELDTEQVNASDYSWYMTAYGGLNPMTARLAERKLAKALLRRVLI